MIWDHPPINYRPCHAWMTTSPKKSASHPMGMISNYWVLDMASPASKNWRPSWVNWVLGELVLLGTTGYFDGYFDGSISHFKDFNSFFEQKNRSSGLPLDHSLIGKLIICSCYSQIEEITRRWNWGECPSALPETFKHGACLHIEGCKSSSSYYSSSHGKWQNPILKQW